MNQGRQPERRAQAQQALARVRTGSNALLLLDWEHVDVLPAQDIEWALNDLKQMAARLGAAQFELARAHAKRTSQSVSGRLQPQIDALIRKLEGRDFNESLASEQARLIEENAALRARLNRVGEALI